MGDGPFREPQEPGGTPGRAKYGGLAPLVEDMGKPKPKSSDPYFQPPADNGKGRATPFLDPPAFKPGGDQPPAAQPPAAQPPADVRPPDQPKWKPPAQTQDWKTPQPYSGGDKTGDPLAQATGSKSKMLVQTRDVERGSTTSLAIIAGTGSGLLTEPLVKGLGIATDKGAALEGSGLGTRLVRGPSTYWKSNFDPVGINASQIVKEETHVATSFKSIQSTHELDKRLLNKLTAKETLSADESKHFIKLKDGLKIKDEAKLVEVLMERQTYMDPKALQALNATNTGEHIETIRSLGRSRAERIFTSAEVGFLETRQTALSQIDKLEVAQKGATAETKWLTGKGALQNAKTAFLLTAGTGLFLGADHSVRDRMYGQNAPSWETTSLSVPIAMALGNGMKGKIGLGVTALAGGHLIDAGIPAPAWVPESFKHFSAFDALPLGVAFAIPSKNNMAKAFLVGGAALGGNALESAFSPASTGDVEETALKTNVKDKTERSISSYEKSVTDFRDLGKKNEIVLEQNLAQVLNESNKNYRSMSQEEKLGAHRTTAALAQALGENRLEKGTRLSVGTTDKPTYILDGMNMDMGGDALAFLMMARNSVRGSKQMTEIMMDKPAFGTIVTKQEVADLDKAADKVNADIETINGKHDLVKTMDKLKAFLERGTTSSGATFSKEIGFHKTFVDDINRKLGRNMPQLKMSNGELNPDATMMVSKLLRDQALAKMTHAAYKLDHGDDPIGAGQMIFGTPQGRKEWLPGTQNEKGFDGALEAIMLAERLSPNNPDLPELKAIATRLADQIKAKVPDQYNNYKSNPLGVKP
ncbi:MAG: hypothetical protein SGJ27_10715 [Candidatus Melainabacteria bacterium]|nr:hypothetical protein [Candidatus Melainabacteria bacterium]